MQGFDPQGFDPPSFDGSVPANDWTRRPFAILVIGVSGSGKTTVARALAPVIDATFLEGDDYHSPANIAKMRSGTPLSDADRSPWLARIGVAIAAHMHEGRSVVVSCSALRRTYRDDLVRATGRPLVFVHLTIERSILEARMNARRHHFMPTSLLDDQLATLEPLQRDEIGTEIAETGTVAETVEEIERWLRTAMRSGSQQKGRPGRPSSP